MIIIIILTDRPTPLLQQLSCVHESEVCQAVLSFPSGSAGGLDGLHPQNICHLFVCREAGHEFLFS